MNDVMVGSFRVRRGDRLSVGFASGGPGGPREKPREFTRAERDAADCRVEKLTAMGRAARANARKSAVIRGSVESVNGW